MLKVAYERPRAAAPVSRTGFGAVNSGGHRKMKRAAIGLRMHSGWGALVVMSNDVALEVVDRRHIVVAQATIPGSKQPYHYAENLELEQAGAYIARCSGASGQLASAAIHEILSELEKNEYSVEGSALLMGSGRTLPSLEKVLVSHALIHTAEGDFFRTVVRQACEDAGVFLP